MLNKVNQCSRTTMYDFLKIALLLPLVVYIVYALFVKLKHGKIDHRFYFLEKHKKTEWATRHSNPIEYWFIILVNLAFLSVFIYILFL